MRIINKFIVNELIFNKKRTIITIIGISLSTALIFSSLCIILNFKENFYKYVLENDGDYHAKFTNVSEDQIYSIKNNSNISKIFVTNGVGYSNIETSTGKHFIYLNEFDKEALNCYGIKLIKGRLPSLPSEIIISDAINQSSDIKIEIGDKLTLDLYSYKTNAENIVDQNYVYTQKLSDLEELSKESIFNREYDVVGIIERPHEDLEPQLASGYTAITLNENISNASNVFVKFNNPKDAVKITEKICESLKISNCKINYKLLIFFGVSNSKLLIVMGMALIIFVLSIIIICSIMCISNNFLLSTNEKTKQYSILSSIGADNKQIKRCVISETLILGSIGIVLGIVLGSILSIILVGICDMFIPSIDLHFYFPFEELIITLVLSIVVIYFSNKLPLNKASKISPIVGIRENEVINSNVNSKDVSLIKEMFGVGGFISYKNILRYNSKYKPIIIALTISVVLFVTTFSFITYAMKIAEQNFKMLSYNIDVSYRMQTLDETLKYNEFMKITNMSAVDQYMLNRYARTEVNLLEYVDESNVNLYKKIANNKDNINIMLESLGKEEYSRFVEKLGKSYDECKNGIIYVITNNTGIINNKNKQVNIINLSNSDKILIKSGKEDINLEIVSTTKIAPMGLENISSMTGFFVVSDELLESLNMEIITARICISSSNPSDLCDKIRLLNDNFIVSDKMRENQENRQLLLMISTFLYGFVIIISCVGFTNVSNILNNTINLRKKEFAVLRSVGMTKKEFKKMTILESLFCSLESLVIGIVISSIIAIIIHIIANQIMEAEFIFPILPIAISIIITFIFMNCIMDTNVKKIINDNIIETIKNENN